jgi:hypothetical protein
VLAKLHARAGDHARRSRRQRHGPLFFCHARHEASTAGDVEEHSARGLEPPVALRTSARIAGRKVELHKRAHAAGYIPLGFEFEETHAGPDAKPTLLISR